MHRRARICRSFPPDTRADPTSRRPADGRLYDRTRLKAPLQTRSALPPEALRREVFAHLAAYQGAAEQHDDMTMLILGAGE